MPVELSEGVSRSVKTNTFKVFVSDKLDAGGLKYLEGAAGVEVINTPGLKGEELKKAVRDIDAIVIRSGTTVTEEIMEAAPKLKVIGRAGVGVDNVDVKAATRRGIIVMNTPAGNTVSTAELTLTMILALARKLPQAYTSLKKGEWKRSAFTGTELNRKTLGVFGFGRIGREVTQRALSFGMRVMVYDPFIASDKMKQANTTFHKLEDIVKQADFITVHTPLTPETENMIGEKEFAVMKRGMLIVNCARGGIINETALKDALDKGIVAGAALDVFQEEPPAKDHPLLNHPNVICTPHLGAATVEAQENVSLEVAEQVVDALLGREIRNSVNMPSMDAESARVLRPWSVLAEKLGLLSTQLFEGEIRSVEIRFSGVVTAYRVTALSAAFIKGLLTPVCKDSVNFVNALPMAEERGITVNEVTTTAQGDYTNSIEALVTTSVGTHRIVGTLFGNFEPRIVRINEFSMDAKPRGTVLAVTNDDKPGFVGEIGTILGKSKVNIAEMTLGRQEKGDTAFAMINVDGDVSEDVLKQIRQLPKVKAVKILRF